MAAEIGLLSMTQIQNQNQNQNQPQPSPNSSWMWNPRDNQEDDDSWEVRAFAEDTRNITTWPPRSYTCTFCRREFRSAQALGGHMNVHRRDRARLHQAQPPGSVVNHNPFIIPAQEFVSNGSLCLFYHLPSPNGSFPGPTALNARAESPSTLLSISPFAQNNAIPTCSPPSFDFPVARPAGINLSYCTGPTGSCTKLEEPKPTAATADGDHEELDLELRLGNKPTPTI